MSEEFIFERIESKPDELYHSAGKLKSRRIAHASKIASTDKIAKDDFLKIIGGGGGTVPPFDDFGALLTYGAKGRNRRVACRTDWSVRSNNSKVQE